MDILEHTQPENTLILKLSGSSEIPEFLLRYAEANGLNLKPEFHITIIGTQTAEIMNRFPERVNEIVSFAKNIKWDYSFKNEYFLIQKSYPEKEPPETRTSIIQMIELPELQTLYKKISSLVGSKIDSPLPHITLFTASTNPKNESRGIGIYSVGDFLSLNPKELKN